MSTEPDQVLVGAMELPMVQRSEGGRVERYLVAWHDAGWRLEYEVLRSGSAGAFTWYARALRDGFRDGYEEVVRYGADPAAAAAALAARLAEISGWRLA